MRSKAETSVENFDLPDMDEKKEKLVEFIKRRIKDNPDEKKYILRGEFSDEEDENLELEDKIEKILNGREIKAELQDQCIPSSFMVDAATSPIESSPITSTEVQTE